MDALGVVALWEKDAYDGAGQRLGCIEAIGMGRDRVPRRVGVRVEGGGRRLTFFSLTGGRLVGDRVVLAMEPSLVVLPGAS